MIYKNLSDLPFYNKSEEQKLESIREFSGDLKCSLAIPSISHSYSMCIEYMKEWFEAAFVKDFFKSIYIDGKNVIDDFRGLTREQLIKRPRPCYTMIPRIDYEFNREMVDAYHFGTNLFVDRSRYQDAFYRNYNNNTFISLEQKVLLMRFNFRIKVTTLSMAQDLFGFLNLRFRAGSTMGRELDLDYHIPTNMMLVIAQDNDFKIENDKIVDMSEFLCFLNRNSQLPILYKRRNSTGTNQFFLKMPNSYIHMRIGNINIDDGERQGQILTNYTLEFEVEVRFPSPKFYAYYSMNQYNYIKDTDPASEIITLHEYPVIVPKVNDKQWNQFLTTDYIIDDEEFEKHEPIRIEFLELVGDIRKVIEYTKSIYLSPSLFIDMKLYNNGKLIESAIDWNSYSVATKDTVKDKRIYIVIYVDTNYLNNQIVKMKGEDKQRINHYNESRTVRG